MRDGAKVGHRDRNPVREQSVYFAISMHPNRLKDFETTRIASPQSLFTMTKVSMGSNPKKKVAYAVSEASSAEATDFLAFAFLAFAESAVASVSSVS